MLTAQWTRKLPIIQTTAPAELAARLIHTFLDDFPDVESEQYFVIDFCSGAGGEHILLQKSCDKVGSTIMTCALLQGKHQIDTQAESTHQLPSQTIVC